MSKIGFTDWITNFGRRIMTKIFSATFPIKFDKLSMKLGNAQDLGKRNFYECAMFDLHVC